MITVDKIFADKRVQILNYIQFPDDENINFLVNFIFLVFP